MRTRTLGIIFVACAILSFAQPSLATVLSVWDFGDSSTAYTEAPAYFNTVAAPTLVLSNGTKDPDGKNGVAFTDAASIAHIAGQAGAWDDIKTNANGNASWTIALDTTGFQTLAIRWDYKSELATSFDFSYRTAADGTWTKLLNNQPITADWNNFYSTAIDLSTVTALNNQPFVQLMVDDLIQGPGNNKFVFDNLEITGAVPEPATLLILGLGAMLLKKTKH
jgi:hypothetical protein